VGKRKKPGSVERAVRLCCPCRRRRAAAISGGGGGGNRRRQEPDRRASERRERGVEGAALEKLASSMLESAFQKREGVWMGPDR
jgi:hypothetical protein